MLHRIAFASLVLLLTAPTAFADETVDMVERNASDINSWGFDPPDVTIQAGQTITWINSGAQSHTATASNGTFDTGLLAPGQSKTVALGTAGVFEYTCTPHPWMKGTITVTAAAAAQPTTPPAAPTPAPTVAPAPAAAATQAPVVAPTVARAQPATPTPFRIVAPTTATTPTPAPRAGSLPLDLAGSLTAGGAALAAGGFLLLRRRRER